MLKGGSSLDAGVLAIERVMDWGWVDLLSIEGEDLRGQEQTGEALTTF